MKKSELINLLNQDLSGEIEAILTYMRDSFVTEECKPSRGMEDIAKDEMRHAEKLAEMIVEFGGIPAMLHRELNFGKKGTRGYLKRLTDMEKEAITMYKEHIKAISNEDIKKKLMHILREEEDHLREFSGLLKT